MSPAKLAAFLQDKNMFSTAVADHAYLIKILLLVLLITLLTLLLLIWKATTEKHDKNTAPDARMGTTLLA